MKINVDAQVYLCDVVDSLIREYSQDELFESILEIDRRVADLDFTKKIRDFFVAEVKKEESQNE